MAQSWSVALAKCRAWYAKHMSQMHVKLTVISLLLIKVNVT